MSRNEAPASATSREPPDGPRLKGASSNVPSLAPLDRRAYFSAGPYDRFPGGPSFQDQTPVGSYSAIPGPKISPSGPIGPQVQSSLGFVGAPLLGSIDSSVPRFPARYDVLKRARQSECFRRSKLNQPRQVSQMPISQAFHSKILC